MKNRHCLIYRSGLLRDLKTLRHGLHDRLCIGLRIAA